MKKRVTSFVVMALMLLLTACQGSPRQESINYISEKYSVPSDNQLIVYTSHKEEVYLPIIREFENRTGILVEIHAGGTAEMMQKAREASEEAKCDIMFGGGIESYEAQSDLFLPYVCSEIKNLDTTYVSKEGTWTAFTELPIVFIYNKKLLSPAKAPRSWSDLFDPDLKGKIAFADINNSGTSYTIISTMEQVFSESYDTLLPRFYQQLDGNVLSSSGSVIPEVSDGTYLVGITLEETAKKYIAMGYDISMIYPSDGTSAVPDGIAMVKNAPHSYNAGKFIDFVVGYDTQDYAMENFYRRPVRTDITLSNNYEIAKLIKFDYKKSAVEEPQIFSLWNDLTNKED
ncbi:extracellular solute-binding protein [Butyrivibrio proteoclasticus]|uniref:extracellular solute-binding protein n=1 Tax=Butyrivibrio proteoclasticus TaxID=43305 RepID=UPI000550F32B|nr:extracellular solute-binding protein [Butyrivibrio proteoclasticus]